MIKRLFSPPKKKTQTAEMPTQILPADSSKSRHFGFWGSLPLGIKFFLVFGTLSIFAAIIAIVSLSGLNRVQASYENTLSQGIEMRRLSGNLVTSLLQARDNERNFILHWRDEGFERAYTNYVIPHRQNVAVMHQYLNQLSPFGAVAATVSTGDMTQAQYQADLDSLTQSVNEYEQSFTALVESHRKKGFDDSTDYESQFRAAAARIYAELFFYAEPGTVDQLQINYLQLRTSEYNYIAFGDAQYVVEVRNFISILKEQFTASDQFDDNTKNQMTTQANAYLAAFDQLVELDKQIAVYNQEMINSRSAVEASAAKIETLGNQLAVDGIGSAQSNSTQTFTISIVTALLVFVVSILLAITLLRQLTRPIVLLTNTAKEIAAGKLNIKAEVTSSDEIGTLAETFNNMTDRLESALQNLDLHAKELEKQTEQLELTSRQSSKRAQQLQTIAEIAGYISAEKDLNRLMPLITQTVSEQFGFYHVGIFLIDDYRKFAVLLAANSPGGQKMLQRNHRLEVGQTGIVGNVTGTGIPRIASDTGAEAIYFNNPDLPETRSELALPLKAEGQVIGALDIQSTETAAFSDEDVEALTILADQVAIAIQNARLLNQVEKALAESNAIQRQYIHETWMRLPKEEKISGYRYSLMGAVPLDEDVKPVESEETKDQQVVNIPIVLRGETIGTLSVHIPGTDPIDPDQMDLIRAVAERVALSAENARLFEDTTRRAERERIVAEITSKIGTSVRTENILRTTARELSQLLEDADIFINLQAANNGNGKDGAK